MTKLGNTIRKAFAGLALVAISTGSALASSVDITVGGESFTIGTLTDTYNDNISLMQSQPWWGDQQLAIDVRDAVGSGSILADPFDNGPFFAWRALPSVATAAAFIDFGAGPAPQNAANFSRTGERNFAVLATPAPIPLPAAGFLLVGAVGALGLVRRRRA